MTGIHASVDGCPRAVSFGAPVVSTKLRMLLLSALTGGIREDQNPAMSPDFFTDPSASGCTGVTTIRSLTVAARKRYMRRVTISREARA